MKNSNIAYFFGGQIMYTCLTSTYSIVLSLYMQNGFFAMAVISEVGNGKNTIFWTDRWLLGQSFEQSLPHLFRAVAVRARKKTVHAALTDGSWISDIKGALTLQVLVEYLQLWELLSSIQLQPEVEDKHIRQFSASGQYTTKYAYEALFIGSIECKPWERI